MNIIAVDDEQPVLYLVEKAIRKALPDCSLMGFTSAKEALAYAKNTVIDVAFLDIEMGSMSGLVLAEKLKEIHNKTNIIFITGYSDYAVDAFSLGSSGYIMKPVKPEAIALEISRLRNPPSDANNPKMVDRLGPYIFEHTAKRVYVDGHDALLTPREYTIFYFLVCNPGIYFTPQELYAKTSGLDAGEDANALYPHISRLRKKLGLDDGGTNHAINIEQIRGKGYCLTVHI